MARRLAMFLAVVLMAGMPSPVLAQEPAEGTITGQVVNGTADGGSVEGVQVTLLTYIDDSLAGTRTTDTDEEGGFRFDTVVMEYIYLVSAKYQDVDYYYPVAFEPGESTAFVEIGVCDTTTEIDIIMAGLVRTIITVEEESIQVTRVYWLVNESDRTYVGAGDTVLVFDLPEGAYGFTAPGDLMQDFEKLDDNRVTYLVPFPPGEGQIIYYYQMPLPDDDELTVPVAVDYPADAFEVMVAGEDIEAAMSRLAPADPVTDDTGRRYIRFAGEDLARGEAVTLQLSNLPGGGGFSMVVVWIAAAAVAACVVAFIVVRRKRVSGDD